MDYTATEKVQAEDAVKAGTLYGMLTLASLMGTTNLLRADPAVHPFFKKNSWTYRGF